jgi:hypothetical protein
MLEYTITVDLSDHVGLIPLRNPSIREAFTELIAPFSRPVHKLDQNEIESQSVYEVVRKCIDELRCLIDSSSDLLLEAANGLSSQSNMIGFGAEVVNELLRIGPEIVKRKQMLAIMSDQLHGTGWNIHINKQCLVEQIREFLQLYSREAYFIQDFVSSEDDADRFLFALEPSPHGSNSKKLFQNPELSGSSCSIRLAQIRHAANSWKAWKCSPNRS